MWERCDPSVDLRTNTGLMAYPAVARSVIPRETRSLHLNKRKYLSKNSTIKHNQDVNCTFVFLSSSTLAVFINNQFDMSLFGYPRKRSITSLTNGMLQMISGSSAVQNKMNSDDFWEACLPTFLSSSSALSSRSPSFPDRSSTLFRLSSMMSFTSSASSWACCNRLFPFCFAKTHSANTDTWPVSLLIWQMKQLLKKMGGKKR